MPGGGYGPNQNAAVRSLVARLPDVQHEPEPPAMPQSEQPIAPRPCWVYHPDQPIPGILLAWERHEGTYWGLVTIARLDHGAVVTSSQWIHRDQLRPGVAS